MVQISKDYTAYTEKKDKDFNNFVCFKSLNLVKTLINSVENANKWLTRIEKKLTTPDIILEQSTLSNLSLNIQRTANDLNVSFEFYIFFYLYYCY
jgi:hypothetical protein